MNVYILDSTVSPKKEVHLNSYTEAVRYLEGMSKRAYNQTRQERMIVLEELGHGADDSHATTFVRAMAEAFDIGIVREGRRMRCDITSAEVFKKEEFGD